MTLRLRLTLFYALLVTLILGASGAALYLLLSRDLYAGLDRNLEETADLLRAIVDRNDDTGMLEFDEEEEAPRIRADLTALLVNANGQRLDTLGQVPENLPDLGPGLSSWGDLRILVRPLLEASLVVVRDREPVKRGLESFVGSFLVLLPACVVTAFMLGYLLAGRALRPLGELTRAAYTLAQTRAWRETLPEPARKDELWRLARATNTLLGALADAIETERRFTADAAHELRTPLTVLQGRLERALETVQEAKSRFSIDKALAASDDLLRLTETLLLLARTEAGQEVVRQRVALDEVVFASAETLRPSFAERGLELCLKLPDAPLWVDGDRVMLELLVRNLLDNALKFTSSGGVQLELWREDERVCLAVMDTGPGFPDAALPHVFERFYQAEVSHRRRGSGLGLALARSVARWHGGGLRAENRPSGGACLTLCLPTPA